MYIVQSSELWEMQVPSVSLPSGNKKKLKIKKKEKEKETGETGGGCGAGGRPRI